MRWDILPRQHPIVKAASLQAEPSIQMFQSMFKIAGMSVNRSFSWRDGGAGLHPVRGTPFPLSEMIPSKCVLEGVRVYLEKQYC